MDADFQHDPKLLDSFMKINEEISIILGRRDFSKTMPIHRRLSNKMTSFIISYICGKRILDSQCGYRRYKINMIKNLTFLENGYLFESEILLNCVNRNINIEY